MIMDNSFDVEVEWMRQSSPRGLRGRRRGSRGAASRRRRRGALMAGDVEHMVVDADWAPHGGYQQDYGQMLHDMVWPLLIDDIIKATLDIQFRSAFVRSEKYSQNKHNLPLYVEEEWKTEESLIN